MKKTLLFLALLACLFVNGQYIENTPWMLQLISKNKASKNKSRENKTNKIQEFSIYEISQAFHNYWKDKDYTKKGSGFKPFKRWENYWMNLVDENGYLPKPNELWQVWDNKNNIAMVDNPVANWNSLGPFNTGIQAFGLPGIGRVNAIAVDPNNENIWYVGAPAGGIWKSIDAGENWVNLFDDFPQIGVSGIAIDQNDSNIIYIATGDDDAADSYSVGVYKSLDGGQTWNETGLNPGNSTINSLMNEIVIDPTDSNILWVGTRNGLRKSIDGGDNWTIVLDDNIKDFKLKPGNSSIVYAVSPDTYYRSADGGQTFDIITDILPENSGRLVLGVTPANPEVLYVLSADTPQNGYVYQGLYKSSNSGLTFTESPNTSDLMERDQAWYNMAIEVSPTNENVLFTGAINVWRSIDGGDSFFRLNDNDTDLTEAYTHVDIHTLKIFGNKLYCGSDGGLFVSDDNGQSFMDRTSGMSISQFYRISVADNDASKIVGGTQDNSGMLLNNGDWNVYTGADGMDYEIDPNNQNLIYGFSQFGSILFITSNSGQSVSLAGAPRDDSGARISGNWITPLAVASDGNVYAGYDAVYKLNGSQWEFLSSAIGTTEIEDIEVDPNDPLNIYVANDDFIYRSQNGGQTFIPLRSFGSDISSIAINESDGNVIYVTTSRRVGVPQRNQPSGRGVYRLTDNGGGAITVDDLTLNLPTDQAFFSVAHQKRDVNNPIYVGTNLGVYRLDDTLSEWEEFSTGLPNLAVSDLEININEGLITASTYGRGIWRSPIPVQLPDNDIRILSATPEQDAVLCGEIVPEVVVTNSGLNQITEITVLYTLNDGSPVEFIWTGTLDSEQNTTIQLPSLNGVPVDRNEINFTVSIDNDAFDDNNSIVHQFVLNNFGVGDDLFDFETEVTTLVTANETGDGSVWERGVPSGTLLSEATSGTQVLGTNLGGNHPDGIKGFIYSGCYEFSSIVAPVLKFNMAYDLENNFDIVYVEYSIDQGSSWSVLGNVGSQPNWYNSDRTNASSGNADDCQNCPGAQWTGTNDTMTEYAYDFVANAALGELDLTAENNVNFRIVFHSDPAVNQEGVIIDDFVIEGLQDDEDDDNDGILDVDDNCPLIGNANQLDTDGDNDGDACDTDDDNDGILDVDDNCPLTPNTNQADADEDGIGDVCDTDSDNDGVPNTVDLCDNTPIGAVVNVDGCEIFSLPTDNFSVLVQGESCAVNNNGSITVTTANELSYTASLTDSGSTDLSQDFTTETSFTDLAAGDYQLCIMVDGESDFSQCFDITVTEPDGLAVSSKISALTSEVILELSGGQLYTIVLNETIYKTSKNTITLPLSKIENNLVVKTDLDCQGIFEQQIILSEEVLIYPNPISSGALNVYLGKEMANPFDISIFTINGKKVFNKSYTEPLSNIELNVDNFQSGIYLLSIRTEKSLLNYKVIKK